LCAGRLPSWIRVHNASRIAVFSLSNSGAVRGTTHTVGADGPTVGGFREETFVAGFAQGYN
jgi:hypothetical protein